MALFFYQFTPLYGHNPRATSKVDKISKSNVLTVIEQVMSGTAFGKITAVYGQIDENWEFVRKNSTVSDPNLRTNAPKSGFCP